MVLERGAAVVVGDAGRPRAGLLVEGLRAEGDAETDAWASCIADNYGSTALEDHGSISGFKVNTEVKDANEVTTQVRDTISTSKQNVLWFEALFSTKATTVSQTNAAGLVAGSMKPEQFMQTVQDALAAQ